MLGNGAAGASKLADGELPLLLTVERNAGEALGQQIYKQIRALILDGLLAPGARLPPTRRVADELGCSRTTVITAFERLWSEGYLTGRVGSGTFVSRNVPSRTQACGGRAFDRPDSGLSTRGRELAKAHQLTDYAHSRLFPGHPEVSDFPHDLWLKLARKAWRNPDPDLVHSCDPAGYRPLREAISKYLASFRRIACDPDEIIVTSGATQAIELITRIVTDPGDQVWIEDPSIANFRFQFAAASNEIIPVPVDEEGIQVAAGIEMAPSARLAFVTPAHQFPLGYTMSLRRRLQLLQWASEAGAWIIEDDYDCEYRYVSNMPAPLADLDSSRVFYVGSFSKFLLPSLRIGFLVLPSAISSAFVRARSAIDRHPPVYIQPILADFIAEGHFTKYIRHMRSIYDARKRALVSALRTHLSDHLEIWDSGAGIQVTVHLKKHVTDATSDKAIERHAAYRGLPLRALSDYYAGDQQAQGLVLGCGRLHIAEADSTIQLLRDIIGECVAHSVSLTRQWSSSPA